MTASLGCTGIGSSERPLTSHRARPSVCFLSSPFYDFADPDRQIFDGEGLHDHLHAGCQEARCDACMCVVTGDEEHLQMRAHKTCVIGELAIVQAYQPR